MIKVFLLSVKNTHWTKKPVFARIAKKSPIRYKLAKTLRTCQCAQGPGLGHKRAMFRPFLEKGATGYTKQCEIWHGTSLGTLIKIQEELISMNIWGPYFGHKKAIFCPFLGKEGYGIQPKLWNLAWSIPGHIDYDLGKRQCEGPCEDHVLAIKGLYFGHF